MNAASAISYEWTNETGVNMKQHSRMADDVRTISKEEKVMKAVVDKICALVAAFAEHRARFQPRHRALRGVIQDPVAEENQEAARQAADDARDSNNHRR